MPWLSPLAAASTTSSLTQLELLELKQPPVAAAAPCTHENSGAEAVNVPIGRTVSVPPEVVAYSAEFW